jgi:hypothetical protein
MARQVIMTGTHAEQFVRQLMPQIEVQLDANTLEQLRAALPTEQQEPESESDTPYHVYEPKQEGPAPAPTKRRCRPSQEDSIKLCLEYRRRWEQIARSTFAAEPA